jgi:tetratricopeptide (TPR) repeat protein
MSDEPTPPPRRRAPLGALGGGVAALFVGVLLLPAFGWLLLSPLDSGALGASPSEQHAARARELLQARRYEDALAELELAMADGLDDADVQMDLARCMEGLGRPAEAEMAYDAAIGDGHWWPPYTEKAAFLRRSDGQEAAFAWLASLDVDPTEHKFAYLQGSFRHFTCGDRAGAISFYEEATRRAAARHGFRFDDDGWLVRDAASLEKENNDYADLWPTLEYLAECRLATGDVDGALRAATMGVSIGQQLNRCKGYYAAPEVEAGSVPCRVLRARALIRDGRLDAVERELALAQPLADRSSYSGHARAIADARRELDAARRR